MLYDKEHDFYFEEHEPDVKVILKCTGEYLSENDVEFLNIEEDIMGRDLLTFKCPKCGQEHKSFRLG